jgi:NADP-dependent 3-hydroxy acid dehydrogenase YdfG
VTPRPLAPALAGRRAVVTGASRGIGAAVVRALAEAGALVAATARSADRLAAVIDPLGAGHVAIAADLTTESGTRALIHAVEAWAAGAPDIIVNNAGAFAHGRVAEQDPDGFAQALRINLEAPFRVVHAFIPAMVARKSGDIVTVGSVADKQAFAGNAAYSASKFGLRAVHEVLRVETRGTGVRAILVSPSAVDTDIWAPVESQLGKNFPTRDAMLSAADVARAICFALSQPGHVTIDELRLTRS